MANNTIQKIDEALATLATEKSIEAGLRLASFLLEHMSAAGIKSTDPNSIDFILLTALKLPNAERYDHWFQAHPKFKSDRACFALNDIKQSPIEAKLYALKTKRKLYISGATHFTSNFEDALFTRQDLNAKVGIDFFLPPSNDSLLVVVSNNKSLRVVELKDRLTNTQKDIFAKWSNVASLEREQLHLTIWDSFKLKSINEAFYKGIANSFNDLVSHLEAAGKSSNEARHFANRLHGRLLFCWFLDKKGFINHEVNYFDTTHSDATQYYRDKLELLFFDTLNTPQNEREQSHPDQKTPYLNGGLFEAQPDDWRGSNVPFPQGFFVRLYEHFGEFNFTTDESTPDYEQIAIDPEMLGKIFENLLAEINEDTGEQARKAKGAFYTPREIVAYMCRETVREYLYTATKATERDKKSIDIILDKSPSDWAISGTNSKRDAVEPALREKIVKALDEMKVLDPACGSGAFPIGMLHLLVQTYDRIDTRFDPYRTKLGIMERNIYGVDIEPLAIEIARLRSFLALVVDQEYVEKKPNGGIDTLPNLEFKFVCANTLIPLTRQNSLGDGGKYETLLDIKKEYFKADPKKREKLETKYSTLRQQGTMFDSQMNEQLQTYDPFNNNHPAGFYDQHLMHDVTGAFSITIGNPPYISSWNMDKAFKQFYTKHYKSATGHYDLYVLFMERSIALTDLNGCISLITSNKYLTQKYGLGIRRMLKEKKLLKIINFNTKVFQSATVDTAIIAFLNRDDGDDSLVDVMDVHNYEDFAKKEFIQIKQSKLSENSFRLHGDDLSDDLKVKMLKNSIPLYNFCYVDAGIVVHSEKKSLKKDSYIYDTPKPELKEYCEGKNIQKNFIKDVNKFIEYKPEEHHRPKFKELFENQKILIKDIAGNSDVISAIDEDNRYVDQSIRICVPLEKLNNVKHAQVESYRKKIKTIHNTDIYYIQGVLGSKALNFFFSKFLSDRLHISPHQIKSLPIPLASKEDSFKVSTLIKKIIDLKKTNTSADVVSLESEIDQLAYKLYGLTPEEIALIEGA